MKDEASNISRALASVPGGSPMLAIDAESNDRSVAIARAHGARVIVRSWTGFVDARRFALGCVTTPWTFMLDADEALDKHLVSALRALEPPADLDGYLIKRSTYLCGRAIRYGPWGNELLLRFFRTASATIAAQPVAGGSAEVHEQWSVPGATAIATGSLLHYSYPSIATYDAKFARYTALEAAGIEGSVLSLARAVCVGLLRIPYALVARGGWRDGWRGVFVAVGSAAYPVAVAWKALRG